MFEGGGTNASTDDARKLSRKAGALFFIVLAAVALCQDRPIFTAEADLQSIAVEVTDHQGRDIRGLTAADFTLFEDGRPQKIAFFGAEEQPISLAVLVDSSTSMRSGNKLERVQETLPPLLRGNLPGDEIYFAQFTDRVFPVQPLTGDERMHAPFRQVDNRAGTAFYDALASALCTLRGARNLRQAVVVITDGADQHSRLSLDELIQTARASRPQIFTIGYFDDHEAEIFRDSGKVVTLVNSHDIDNPLRAFERISKETGAESFFPANQHDLEKALARILGILRAQYTLAYHTKRPNTFRRIQIKVNRSGAIVSARRAVGSVTEDGGMAHFSTTSCEISASEHPHRWEMHVTKTPDGLRTYLDSFSDPQSGWPVHAGLRYAAGAYEISISPPTRGMISAPGRGMNPVPAESLGTRVLGEIAAYGPWFDDFRASVKIEPHGEGDGGLVFRVNERGYYLLLLQRGKGASDTARGGNPIAYKLVKRFWNSLEERPIVPWTPFHLNRMETTVKPGPVNPSITAMVECTGKRITVRIDGIQAISLNDDTFTDGQVGVAFFGSGHGLFRDLQVEESKQERVRGLH